MTIPRLWDSDLIQHSGELEPVLSPVYWLGRGAQDAGLLPVQVHCDVVGQLSSHAQDYPLWVLYAIDIHHHLEVSKQ